MSANVRLGLVGTGRMATTMLRTVAAVPGVEIVGIASGNLERAQTLAAAVGVPYAFGSVAELLTHPDIDGLYVAGRTAEHFAAAMAGLTAGKPVLVEKPLTATLEEAETLVTAAHSRGILLMENLWCLALPAYRRLAFEVASGRYGNPVQLTFDFGYPVTPAAYPSLFDPADGGALRDRGVYGVSLALHLLGPVDNMTTALQRDTAGTDLAASLLLRHQSGTISYVAVALNALLSNVAALACTEGLLRLEAPVIGAETLAIQHVVPLTLTGVATADQSMQQRMIAKLKGQSMLRRIRRLRGKGNRRFLSYGPDPYAPLLAHFCDLIRRNQKESDLVRLELSLATQRILHAALADSNGV